MNLFDVGVVLRQRGEGDVTRRAGGVDVDQLVRKKTLIFVASVMNQGASGVAS